MGTAGRQLLLIHPLAPALPGLFLLTIWALIAPTLVVERRAALEAFGRSRELVRGNGLRVFALVIIFVVISAIAANVLGQLFGGIVGGLAGYAIGTLFAGRRFIALAGVCEADTATKTFVSWFGPKGVAAMTCRLPRPPHRLLHEDRRTLLDLAVELLHIPDGHADAAV